MENLTQLNEHIHRLTVPYKDIFTTVYFIRTPEGVVIFDTASSSSDAEQYILPALAELGISAQGLKYIFISHNHTDHAFGIDRLMAEFPHLIVLNRNRKYKEEHPQYQVVRLEDGDALAEVLQVVAIPGHTVDSAALLDKRTGTLITGDCFQLYGIFGSGLWGANIRLPAEHLAALEKVRAMTGIETIATAHDYHPCGPICRGAAEIALCLDSCAAPLLRLKEMLLADPSRSDADIVAEYNHSKTLPTVGAHVAAAIREALAAGTM